MPYRIPSPPPVKVEPELPPRTCKECKGVGFVQWNCEECKTHGLDCMPHPPEANVPHKLFCPTCHGYGKIPTWLGRFACKIGIHKTRTKIGFSMISTVYCIRCGGQWYAM